MAEPVVHEPGGGEVIDDRDVCRSAARDGFEPADDA